VPDAEPEPLSDPEPEPLIECSPAVPLIEPLPLAPPLAEQAAKKRDKAIAAIPSSFLCMIFLLYLALL
jgi:hypothetical protein